LARILKNAISSAIPASSIVIADSFARHDDAAGPHTFGCRVTPFGTAPESSRLNRVVAICDPFQSFQQGLDSLVKQFACAFSVFVFREELEHAIELFHFFLDTPDFRQQSLNLEQDGGMFLKRKIMFPKRCNQFRQIPNSLLTADEYLHTARIANEIRLRMLLV
jgi:hypothetical protein